MVTEELIQVGSRVTVVDHEGEEEFLLVGREDADIGAGRLSNECPLGEALLGRAPGDEVSVRAPGGLRTVRVTRVL
jgi:transcription elongation factor GreA